MISIQNDQIQIDIRHWLPAILSGAIVALVFLLVGNTPPVRAFGLGLTIAGIALAMRRMGAWFATIGVLVLAFSPAFWSQSGGGQTGEPATIVIAVGIAAIAAAGIILLARRPSWAIGIGILIFTLLFWSQIGTSRSLRLTGFVTAWLMYLMFDMLILTNPRPEDSTPRQPYAYHTYGILLFLTIGILNDPLLTLLLPAVWLSLFLIHHRLPWLYWIAFLVVLGIGLRGILLTYLTPEVAQVDLSLWRNGHFWVNQIEFVFRQFSIVGVLISIMGVARLARWYPALGTVTMIGYAAYWLFGLVYIGANESVLLLPLLIIQTTWMTFAFMGIGTWLDKVFPTSNRLGVWVAVIAYAILLAYQFLQVLQLERIL